MVSLLAVPLPSAGAGHAAAGGSGGTVGALPGGQQSALVDKGAVRAASEFCEELLVRGGLEVLADLLHSHEPAMKAAGEGQ